MSSAFLFMSDLTLNILSMLEIPFLLINPLVVSQVDFFTVIALAIFCYLQSKCCNYVQRVNI